MPLFCPLAAKLSISGRSSLKVSDRRFVEIGKAEVTKPVLHIIIFITKKLMFGSFRGVSAAISPKKNLGNFPQSPFPIPLPSFAKIRTFSSEEIRAQMSPTYFPASSVSGVMISYNPEKLEIFRLFLDKCPPWKPQCVRHYWHAIVVKCLLVILEVNLEAKIQSLQSSISV